MAQWQLVPPEGTSRLLRVDLTGDSVRAAAGSMVAYDGKVDFKKTGMSGSGGLRGALKRGMTGESISLMDCTGRGSVWFAVDAMEIALVHLSGDTLRVESEQLLAMEPGLKSDVAFAGVQGMTGGQGLFTTTVTGHGQVALLSMGGPPIALEVTPSTPLVVDPDAFIASTGQMQPSFVTDVSWRNLVGESSGEAFSLRFQGSGVVYIQPEER